MNLMHYVDSLSYDFTSKPMILYKAKEVILIHKLTRYIKAMVYSGVPLEDFLVLCIALVFFEYNVNITLK